MAAPLKTPLGFNPIPNLSTAAPIAAEPAAPAGLVDQVKGAFQKVNSFRDSLNLPNPGTYEGVNREVKRKEELSIHTSSNNNNNSLRLLKPYSFFLDDYKQESGDSLP